MPLTATNETTQTKLLTIICRCTLIFFTLIAFQVNAVDNNTSTASINKETRQGWQLLMSDNLNADKPINATPAV